MNIDLMFEAIKEFTGLADGVQEYSDKLTDSVYDARVSGVDVGVYRATSVTSEKREVPLTKPIRKKSKVGTPKGVVSRRKSKGGLASGNSGGGASGAGASGAGALGL